MTLTFDLAIWLLFATHCLIMMIICAKLFSNPTMHNKVMSRTQTGFTEVYAQSLSADCDLDLWPSHMVLVCDTSSCHDDHLCQIIFKCHLVQLSYGPDMILEYTNTHIYTHTDRVNSICPSAISWRGHKKGWCTYVHRKMDLKNQIQTWNITAKNKFLLIWNWRPDAIFLLAQRSV